MKHIKNIFYVFAVFFVTSCGLAELDLLDNPNQVAPENAQSDLFFTAINLDINNLFLNVNGSTERVTRHLAMTGGNVYENAFAATSYNPEWRIAYANLLPDLDKLIELTQEDVLFYAGASKVLKAYTLMTLVDMFGDVPYSEAGQGVSNLSPIADDDESIYNEALSLLNDGIADLNTYTDPITSSTITSSDLFYSGDYTKWIKFANTLKIKWYLNVGSGAGANGADITAAAANAITDAADDFAFQFGVERDSPNSRHPWYNNGYENGATIYQSNYFMWELKEEKGIEDPRLKYYFYREDLTPKAEIDAFTLDCGYTAAPLHYTVAGFTYPYCHLGEGYWGRDHGNDDGIPPDSDRRTVAGVYPAGGLYDSGQGAASVNGGTDGDTGGGISPIMLSSFTHFMLAEAALTRATGADAAVELEMAVRQSISKVMASGAAQADTLAPSAADVDAYVQIVMDNFAAAANPLEVVIKEYHIALWGNGIETYNAVRRTTFPTNLQPTLEANSGDFPRLMYYPADYLNLNASISTQRALTDQVFWDKNAAGVIK